MRNEQGFTLIEVIIALVILAVGLTGLLGMSVQSFRLTSENDKWTTARFVAQSQLEQLTSQTYDNLVAQAGSPATANGTSTESVNQENYTVAWSLSRMGGTASSPVQVNVFVTYPNAMTGVSLSTVKTFYL